ncbi:MAG: transposase [Planctomycetia bacterium]|nr:transposase [Planctomycetia bacterium]
MVHAYHVIFSAYGFWLPNDPRGSWSDFVGAWELLRFGNATKTTERRSLAWDPHDVARRLAAKQVLKYPAVQFTGIQARAVGRGFGQFVKTNGLTIWACAILPEHVHMIIARHHYKVEQIVNLLKGDATRRLKEEGLHPFANYQAANGKLPKCWGRGEWKVFIDNEPQLWAAIRYVERNPLKENKPLQRWPFVVPFEGLGKVV